MSKTRPRVIFLLDEASELPRPALEKSFRLHEETEAFRRNRFTIVKSPNWLKQLGEETADANQSRDREVGR